MGNISESIVSASASRSLVSHNGTVGRAVRKVQEFLYPFPRGSLLVLHSDGLATSWRLDQYPGTAEREADWAVLHVRDSGIGIRPDLLPRMFDLFVQADRALDRALNNLPNGMGEMPPTMAADLTNAYGITRFDQSAARYGRRNIRVAIHGRSWVSSRSAR